MGRKKKLANPLGVKKLAESIPSDTIEVPDVLKTDTNILLDWIKNHAHELDANHRNKLIQDTSRLHSIPRSEIQYTRSSGGDAAMYDVQRWPKLIRSYKCSDGKAFNQNERDKAVEYQESIEHSRKIKEIMKIVPVSEDRANVILSNWGNISKIIRSSNYNIKPHSIKKIDRIVNTKFERPTLKESINITKDSSAKITNTIAMKVAKRLMHNIYRQELVGETLPLIVHKPILEWMLKLEEAGKNVSKRVRLNVIRPIKLRIEELEKNTKEGGQNG